MTQYALPDADDTDGSWTDKDGGTVLYTSIDDAVGSADDVTTYIKVEDFSSNEVCIVRLGDVSAPGSSGTYIKFKALTTDNSSMGGEPRLQLELLQGDIVKATTPTTIISTSSWTAYSHQIADVSGISDWTALKMRITMVSQGTGMSDYMQVTQVYLETQDAAAAATNNSQSFSLVAVGAMGTSFSLVGDDESPANVRI